MQQQEKVDQPGVSRSHFTAEQQQQEQQQQQQQEDQMEICRTQSPTTKQSSSQAIETAPSIPPPPTFTLGMDPDLYRESLVNYADLIQNQYACQRTPDSKARLLQKVAFETGEKQQRLKGTVPGNVMALEIPFKSDAVDYILDYKEGTATTEELFLVKFRDTSYRELAWINRRTLSREKSEASLSKFLQKWHDGDFQPVTYEQYEQYTHLDRIVTQQTGQDLATSERKLYYLCKWQGLGYQYCNWESAADIEKSDPEAIIAFSERQVRPPVASSLMRPTAEQFVKFDSSPIYQNGLSLLPHQLDGLNRMRANYYSNRACMLADDPGLGKMVQTIAFLNDLYYGLGIKGPFIIYANPERVPHWADAIKKWTNLNAVEYSGSYLSCALARDTEFYYQDSEGNNIPDLYKFDVVVASYRSLDYYYTDTLAEIHWRCGVFDDFSVFKYRNSKKRKAFSHFRIEHRIGITSQPFQCLYMELLRMLHFLQPTVLGKPGTFYQPNDSNAVSSDVERLQTLLRPYFLRRVKDDIDNATPATQETVIEVELTLAQLKWYRDIMESNFIHLSQGYGKDVSERMAFFYLANILIQLRLCCLHPYLLDGAQETIVAENNANTPEEKLDLFIRSSGKMILLDKLLKKFFAEKRKVVILSHFTVCLDLLSDYLSKRQYPHARSSRFNSDDEKQDAFDDPSFVFLLHSDIENPGIDLSTADTYIIFDSHWNPQTDLQIQARCRRIGNTNHVKIYRLLCTSTYEQDTLLRAGMVLDLEKTFKVRKRISAPVDEAIVPVNVSNAELERLIKVCGFGVERDEKLRVEFCEEEDVNKLLARHSLEIQYTDDGRFPMFSRPTHHATTMTDLVLDDPDFWTKWAAKAGIDTTKKPAPINCNILIQCCDMPDNIISQISRKLLIGKHQVLTKKEPPPVAMLERNHFSHIMVNPWERYKILSFCKELRNLGYGNWENLQGHFPTRTRRGLRAVARQWLRQVLQHNRHSQSNGQIELDITEMLDSDHQEDDADDDDTIPYQGANEKEIAEFRSFFVDATTNEKIVSDKRVDDNYLEDIQTYCNLRSKIIPKNWEEAKKMKLPTLDDRHPPARWWGPAEDRDLLLGVFKYGMIVTSQGTSLVSDPEFCFSRETFVNTVDLDASADRDVYIWPTKYLLTHRVGALVAACLSRPLPPPLGRAPRRRFAWPPGARKRRRMSPKVTDGSPQASTTPVNSEPMDGDELANDNIEMAGVEANLEERKRLDMAAALMDRIKHLWQ